MCDLMNTYLGNLEANQRPMDIEKVLLFNEAQRRLIDDLHRGVTAADLVITVTNQSIGSSDGSFDLSGLTYLIRDDNLDIEYVKLYGGKYCHRMSEAEFQAMENAGYYYGDSDPVCIVRGDTLYVRPYAGQTIDIRYRREPFTMALDVASGSIETGASYTVRGYTKVTYNSVEYAADAPFTGVAGKTTYTTEGQGTVECNCELNAVHHLHIVGLACEAWVDESIRGARAYGMAEKYIARMNLQYPETDSFRKGIHRDVSGAPAHFNIYSNG
jgi:hypothetical protein